MTTLRLAQCDGLCKAPSRTIRYCALVSSSLQRKPTLDITHSFHYSGHGGTTKDLDGDEEDGTDETIYPIDHERAGMIVDDVRLYFSVTGLDE